MIFCDAEASQLGYLHLVLLFFQMVSGLQINIAKSKILPVSVVANIDSLASSFGCKIASLPSSYLGLPIGAPFKNKATWNQLSRNSNGAWRDGKNKCCLKRGDAS